MPFCGVYVLQNARQLVQHVTSFGNVRGLFMQNIICSIGDSTGNFFRNSIQQMPTSSFLK